MLLRQAKVFSASLEDQGSSLLSRSNAALGQLEQSVRDIGFLFPSSRTPNPSTPLGSDVMGTAPFTPESRRGEGNGFSPPSPHCGTLAVANAAADGGQLMLSAAPWMSKEELKIERQSDAECLSGAKAAGVAEAVPGARPGAMLALAMDTEAAEAAEAASDAGAPSEAGTEAETRSDAEALGDAEGVDAEVANAEDVDVEIVDAVVVDAKAPTVKKEKEDNMETSSDSD